MKLVTLCINTDSLPTCVEPGLYDLDFNSINDESFNFLNRSIVDSKDNPEYHEISKQLKQILGYVVIRNESEILTYSRSKSGDEPDLHNSRSIGFGGHVDLNDCDFDDANISVFKSAVYNSIIRELSEEVGLKIPAISTSALNTCIIDNSNYVGESHIGLPLIYDVQKDEIHPNHEIKDIKWVSIEELQSEIDLYESWSKILINLL